MVKKTPSQLLQQVLKQLETAFARFFEKSLGIQNSNLKNTPLNLYKPHRDLRLKATNYIFQKKIGIDLELKHFLITSDDRKTPLPKWFT